MRSLIERLRDEADDTHKNWYLVASEEQRKYCRNLTLEAADRLEQLEAERLKHAELMLQATYQINSFSEEVPRLLERIAQLEGRKV
jgi:DNA-binding MarR family transcriptional regulator